MNSETKNMDEGSPAYVLLVPREHDARNVRLEILYLTDFVESISAFQGVTCTRGTQTEHRLSNGKVVDVQTQTVQAEKVDVGINHICSDGKNLSHNSTVDMRNISTMTDKGWIHPLDTILAREIRELGNPKKCNTNEYSRNSIDYSELKAEMQSLECSLQKLQMLLKGIQLENSSSTTASLATRYIDHILAASKRISTSFSKSEEQVCRKNLPAKMKIQPLKRKIPTTGTAETLKSNLGVVSKKMKCDKLKCGPRLFQTSDVKQGTETAEKEIAVSTPYSIPRIVGQFPLSSFPQLESDKLLNHTSPETPPITPPNFSTGLPLSFVGSDNRIISSESFNQRLHCKPTTTQSARFASVSSGPEPASNVSDGERIPLINACTKQKPVSPPRDPRLQSRSRRESQEQQIEKILQNFEKDKVATRQDYFQNICNNIAHNIRKAYLKKSESSSSKSNTMCLSQQESLLGAPPTIFPRQTPNQSLLDHPSTILQQQTLIYSSRPVVHPNPRSVLLQNSSSSQTLGNVTVCNPEVFLQTNCVTLNPNSETRENGSKEKKQ